MFFAPLAVPVMEKVLLSMAVALVSMVMLSAALSKWLLTTVL